MKRIFMCFAMMMAMVLSVFAQIPQAMSYQGVVRDADNKLVADKQVTVSVQILQGADDGTAVYSETHEVTTNANGLMTFELGSKKAEDFAKIDWSNAPYFVKTVAEFDGKQIQGVTPLLAVPYALYAAKAGNAEVDLSGFATKEELPTDYVSSSALNTAISGVEAKIPAATDLSEYYKKSDVDALLAELNAKVTKLDKQLNPPIPGAIEFAFSVSADKQIYFSQGNLQYQASTGTWRFAEHQYDMIGDDNANISSTNSGWIDLFGWGTSGYNGKNPYMTSTDYSDYGDGYNDIAGTNYDWGVYNAISNGGNQAGLWRTLTDDEWQYLISGRAQASRLMGQGRVNNVNGLILLPDGWETPSSVKFTYDPGNYSTNVYSQDEWTVMESYGAVFLPAAGNRDGANVRNVGTYGLYWSSSYGNRDSAYIVSFRYYNVTANNGSNRIGGFSVRVVQDAE